MVKNWGLVFRSEVFYSSLEQNLFKMLRRRCSERDLESVDLLWHTNIVKDMGPDFVLENFERIKGVYVLLDCNEVKSFYDCKIKAFGQFTMEYDISAVAYPLEAIRSIVDLDVADKFYGRKDPFVCGFEISIKRIIPNSL